MTAAVAARVRARDTCVVHDLAPDASGMAGRGRAGLATLAAVTLGRTRHLYAAVLAGRGTWAVTALALAARMRGVPVTLHHHSFAYLDRRWTRMAALIRAGGPSARHVTLCPGMAHRLRDRYGAREVSVVPNAAFVEPGHPGPTSAARRCLGFVGAVSRAKGAVAFSELARRLRATHTAVAAGPLVDPAALSEAVAHRPPSADPGTLFAGMDVVCLPSRYAHEAQPLVVLEALARGIPVIALGRGCLPGMAAPPGLTVLPPGTAFAPAAARVLARLPEDAGAHARSRYERWADAAEPAAEALVTSLTQSTSA